MSKNNEDLTPVKSVEDFNKAFESLEQQKVDDAGDHSKAHLSEIKNDEFVSKTELKELVNDMGKTMEQAMTLLEERITKRNSEFFSELFPLWVRMFAS